MSIDLSTLESELKQQLDERPYVTLAAVAVLGWTLGRQRPWGALMAMAGFGLRSGITSALESALRENRAASPTRMRG